MLPSAPKSASAETAVSPALDVVSATLIPVTATLAASVLTVTG